MSGPAIGILCATPVALLFLLLLMAKFEDFVLNRASEAEIGQPGPAQPGLSSSGGDDFSTMSLSSPGPTAESPGAKPAGVIFEPDPVVPAT